MSKNQSKIDERFMAAAIRFARQNEGQTGTNPSVACLLVQQQGDEYVIVGSGVTAFGGRPHAEPLAITMAGEKANGATAYVTLEPCAHHGATPPCAQALIDAGIKRVVTSHVDPDHRVNQQGHKMLEQAGVKIEQGILSDLSAVGLASYLNQKNKNRSYVTVKIAVSEDGLMGLKGKGQVKITCERAKIFTHLLRSKHHAILVGAQTIVEDDPDLTCRLEGLENQSPIRIILDPNNRVPTNATVFKTANQVRTLVVSPLNKQSKTQTGLAKLGVEVLNCDMVGEKIALPELLEDLSHIGISSVLVEGGAETIQSFLEVDLVDELFIYQSPNKIGVDAKEETLIKAPVSLLDAKTKFKKIDQLSLGPDKINHYKLPS